MLGDYSRIKHLLWVAQGNFFMKPDFDAVGGLYSKQGMKREAFLYC